MKLRRGWAGVAAEAETPTTASADRAAGTDRHPGMILGIARFYHDPRGSTRAMLDSQPSDARLLAYAMIAVILQLAGRLVQISADPTVQNVLARTLEQAVSLIFFLPLVYYALAALGTWLASLFGAERNWYLGRAAFFWAALVSAPVILISALCGTLAGPGSAVGMWIGQVGALFFAFALSQTIAEAFGFRSSMLVLGFIICAVVVPLSVIALAG